MEAVGVGGLVVRLCCRTALGRIAGGSCSYVAVGILRNLPEDPGIRGSGAPDHHRVTTGLRHHAASVLGAPNVPVADDGNFHGVLHRSNPFPARIAAIALLAGAGVQCDRAEAAVFCHPGQLYADDLLVVPADAELHRERNGYSGAHGIEYATNSR